MRPSKEKPRLIQSTNSIERSGSRHCIFLYVRISTINLKLSTMSESSSSQLSSAPSNIPEDVDAPATAAISEEIEELVAPVNGKSNQKRAAGQSEASISRVKRTRQGTAPVYKEVDEEEDLEQADDISRFSLKRTPRTPKAKDSLTVATLKLEEETVAKTEDSASVLKATSKRGRKRKLTIEVGTEVDEEVKAKVKRKRKTKEEKEAEAMPLAARTIGSKILIGAHVSSAGGVHNAIANSVHIGGNAFALFLKSQRKWDNPALQVDHCTQFLSNCKEHNYHHPHHAISPIVPHGSYLVNLAHPDPDRTKQAYGAFLDDLDRCRRLGINLYNFHPGSAGASNSRSEAIAHLAGQLNRAHNDPSSGNVITLLETMATAGNVLGCKFEDLANTIAMVEQKDRVGVCLDTCHVFAAGYDLRTPEAFRKTMEEFDQVIGLKYLKALHINDSKAPLNSGRDLHANIGTGFLGLRAFHNVVNEPRLWGLPMVLETPIDVKDKETGKEVPDRGIWAQEIKMLESLVSMDIESEDFLNLETELRERGRAERERIQAQVHKKEREKKSKAEKKGKKKEDGKSRK